MTTATAKPPANNDHTPKKKSRRRYSREIALQGIYQWRVAGGDVDFIEDQLRSTEEFEHTDAKYFSNLLRGVLKEHESLIPLILPCLDRSFESLSPIESSILLISTYELAHCPEIPYRAIINEGVELAKSFGGTDGYKYVNGVIDKLALQLRAIEIQSQKK